MELNREDRNGKSQGERRKKRLCGPMMIVANTWKMGRWEK